MFGIPCVLSATAIGVASRTTREKQGTSAGNLGFTKRTVVSVLCSVFYQRLPWRWLDPEAHPSHEKKQGTTEGNPGSRNVDFLCSVFYQRPAVTAPASIRESALQREERSCCCCCCEAPRRYDDTTAQWPCVYCSCEGLTSRKNFYHSSLANSHTKFFDFSRE